MARRGSDVDCNGMENSMDVKGVNLENYRKLVKSYLDLVSHEFIGRSTITVR